MKRFLLLILISSCCLSGYTQISKKDSLLALLNTLKNDTTKVNVLYLISEESEDDKNILYYATQALQLAEKLNFKKGIADATNNIGYVYDNKGNNAMAMEFYQKSLAIRKEINDQKGIAISLNNIGYLYGETGENDKSLDYLLQSLNILEQTKDSLEISLALHNLSNLYRELGEISMAIDFEERSFRIREKINDYEGMASCYNNMAYIFSQQSQIERAMKYYQKSLQIYEKLGNKRGIAMAYNNMGSIVGDSQKAQELYHKSLKLYESIGNKDGMGSALGNIGIVYLNSKKYDLALQYFTKALKIREEMGNRESIATAYLYIGDIYQSKDNLDLAIEYYLKALAIKKEIEQKEGIASSQNRIGSVYLKQREYKLAENYCLEALTFAKELGYPVIIAEASQTLSKVYEEKKLFKEAYNMHVLYKQMSDSISYSDAVKAVAKMTMQFEFDKKEAVTIAEFASKEALSKKEIEKQKLVRNYTAAGFSLLLICLGSFVIIVTQKRKSHFLQTVSEVEMKALRSQMNPHFIFNSLNSINRYMNANDTDKAGEYLQKFAKVMRMILENSQNQDVLLSDDLKALELYMQLEAMRMNNKFSFEINVDESIDPENTLIPPLILQPFVENAIWHGFSTKEGQGKISIHILKEDHMLKCIVEDNGIGRQKSGEQKNPQPEKKSLGMKITRSRIDIINKIKKTNAGVEITDLPQGTSVKVLLPLELDF